MVVGILSIALSIPASGSLKDKRQVVRSLLDHVRSKFNVSAAEIDSLDSHKRADLAFACVSNDAVVVDGVLNKILRAVDSNPLAEVIESSLELL